MKAFSYIGVKVNRCWLVLGLLLCLTFTGGTLFANTEIEPLLPTYSSIVIPVTMTDQEETGANFLLEIVPLWYLFSPDIDGFKVTSTGGWITSSEEIAGWGSLLPNLRAGIRINTPDAFIDITGGGGYLWNQVVSAPFYLGDLAINFQVSKDLTLGPHIGVLSIDELEWGENADVKFSDSTGFMAGIVFSSGNEKSNSYLAIDYIKADFDVQTGPGWTANRNNLDLSGVAFRLGLVIRF